MEMKNMKMSNEEKADMKASMVAEAPPYPYGLSVNLDEDSIAKLGMGQMPAAGSKMMLHALCEVRDVSISDTTEGGKRRHLCLQITDMGLDPEKEQQDPAKALYGE